MRSREPDLSAHPAGAARPFDQARVPRLCEIVAAEFREAILSGRLLEGDVLPRQDDLITIYKVAPPSLREALRILETEGLISIRRGNVGGAVVHLPSSWGVAYMASLVLQTQETSLDDVGAALQQMEVLCTAMCARRAGGNDDLVARLRGALDAQVQGVGDEEAFDQAARRFHDAVVAECGNKTMILVIGALRSLWDVHAGSGLGPYPDPGQAAPTRSCTSGAHKRLIAAVAAGNGDVAAWLARRHFEATQMFTRSGDKDILVASGLVEAGRTPDA